MKNAKKYILEHWVFSLSVIALGGLIGNLLIFYPGFLSNDSLNQLKQAMEIQPISDLLPPAMTLVWRAMLKVTGSPASMLLVQLFMLWSALLGLALYVFKKTQSYKISFLILCIGLLPGVINISGVIWKDTQMTFAILLAVILILWLQITTKKNIKISLLIISVLLLIYACMMRYNVIPAVIPLIFIAFKVSGLIKRIRYQLIATLGTVIGVMISFVLINSILQVKSGGMSVALIIDDVVNLAQEKDIETSKISPESAKVVRDTSICAREKNVLINNLWVCLKDEDRLAFTQNASEDIKKVWVSAVTSNPIGYLLYRVEVYFLFLFPYENTAYVWQDGIVENDLGLEAKFTRLGDITELYVNNFGYRHFSFLFEPWFWMIGNFAVLAFVRKRVLEHKIIISALTLSSILYLLSFFPTGATPDYRYLYWPVFACMIAIILGCVDIFGSRNSKKRHR